MNYSLYLNGVYESVLEEIRKTQASKPRLVCYLRPVATARISNFAKSPPTQSDPVTIYISLTTSLPFVYYCAEITGWENKFEINTERQAKLNSHIKKHQPKETIIDMDEPSVNIISVINMVRLEVPIHVSNFVKLSDNKPLKPRSKPGRWAYVKGLPAWVGSLLETTVDEQLSQDFEQQIAESKECTQESRTQRLKDAQKLPEPIKILSKGFKRNADVIAEVLLRANGVCENCNKEAPFKRSKDGTPYLEVHHKIMLSQGGEDTVENAIATCPNCHRELHFGVSEGKT